MTAKTNILCQILESHKLHLKTLPVVLWKASRVQRNTGHSALLSPSEYHPVTLAVLPSLLYTAPSWMWISHLACVLPTLGLSVCLSEEDTTAQI